MSSLQVIAMDGPAASGKSSVARRVARQLNWVYVNTGNTYRAATLAVLRAGVALDDVEAITALVKSLDLKFQVEDGQAIVFLQSENVEHLLNEEAVNLAVSKVAALPAVRERLVRLQRDVAHHHAVVMEGRDIGTEVYPDTPWKFYIDASAEVRAARRGLQGHQDAVSERDRLDSTRKVAPLRAAEDAMVIDSTELSIDEVVAMVLQRLNEQGLVVN